MYIKNLINIVLAKLEKLLNKNLRLKIFFHDTDFFIIKRLREKKIKDIITRPSLFPDWVQIEISTQCNASCLPCWIHGIKRPHTIIDDSLYKKIITECAIYKPGIALSWVGEPTLDPGLIDKIKFAKQSGIQSVELYTNGSLMNEALSEQIILSGLDCIMFSVDGLTKPTYELIRKGLDFNLVIGNINAFIKLRNNVGCKCPKININFLKTRFNINEYDGFIKAWKGKVDNIFCWPLAENYSEYGVFNDGERFYKRRLPCFLLWRHMSIYVNGRVGLCGCFAKEEVIMGDVSKQSLKDVWNSDMFKQYRRSNSELSFNELGVCDRCSVWKFPVCGHSCEEPLWYY